MEAQNLHQFQKKDTSRGEITAPNLYVIYVYVLIFLFNVAGNLYAHDLDRILIQSECVEQGVHCLLRKW